MRFVERPYLAYRPQARIDLNGAPGSKRHGRPGSLDGEFLCQTGHIAKVVFAKHIHQCTRGRSQRCHADVPSRTGKRMPFAFYRCPVAIRDRLLDRCELTRTLAQELREKHIGLPRRHDVEEPHQRIRVQRVIFWISPPSSSRSPTASSISIPVEFFKKKRGVD